MRGRVGRVLQTCAVIAVAAGCSDASDSSGGGGSGGGGANGGGRGGAETSAGGAAPNGGRTSAGADSSGGLAGAGGEAACLPGIEGVWKLPGYEAYLQIDGLCQVPMFCDLMEDHHTTGHVADDTLTLTNLATLQITLTGDTLTLLKAGAGGTLDLPFERQASAAVIPSACTL